LTAEYNSSKIRLTKQREMREMEKFKDDLKTASIGELQDMAFHYSRLGVDEGILTEIAKELFLKRKARREAMK